MLLKNSQDGNSLVARSWLRLHDKTESAAVESIRVEGAGVLV